MFVKCKLFCYFFTLYRYSCVRAISIIRLRQQNGSRKLSFFLQIFNLTENVFKILICLTLVTRRFLLLINSAIEGMVTQMNFTLPVYNIIERLKSY